MRNKIGFLTLAAVVLAVSAGILATSGSSVSKERNVSSFYEIDVMDIDGNNVNLGKYKDHVVMFVNTASQCGYTPQYKGLQKIYDKYKDRGFVILGFPANNFGGQEPGSNKEIKEFCTLRYKVTFPMFAKISVKGEDQHQLYKYLTSKDASGEFAGDVTWNFNKFLASHDGGIINRFSSKETPESKEVTDAIEAALTAREEAMAK
ncbi:MAG: glutathione peroxidase [Pyrinomonadaceae bacterium]|nr:glutathione peroxidase [Pyrinomonadaceae bacterium]